MLESHLFGEGSVFVAREMSALTCSFSMYLLRLQIDSSCCVEVGGIEGQYGV